MNNDNRFFNGLLLGVILGGGAVFLLGTKTGKNLLKIISEQGFDGLLNILEDYDLAELENTEDIEEVVADKEPVETKTNNHVESEKPENQTESKRRFFKRRK